MAAHSILPPSGAHAWVKCALWVEMNRRFPQDDTPSTLEGDAAHWAAWELIEGRGLAVGLVAPNGVVVTDEMVDGAELLASVLEERLDASYEVRIEKPVRMPEVHPENWGTPDVAAFSASHMTLELVDYKFGHRFVDEFENWQMVDYTAGLLEYVALKLGKEVGAFDQALRVNITVVQPRCFYKGSPVRTWSILASELRPLFNKLQAAAALALSPNPPAVTSAECQDCPGRHACPSLQHEAYVAAEMSTRTGVAEMVPDAASLELHMLERAYERLGARVEGLREVVANYGRQGLPLKFHNLQQGCGRTTWCIPPEQVIAMGALFNLDLSKKAVITPGQAKKLGVDESVITAYSITPLGSVKLQPINSADARRVFAKTY